MNKYIKWYDAIVENAKTRNSVEGYFETHHIIPKSLGGNNKKDNLVKLTAREHYVCHLLLMKMYTDPNSKQKMAAAFLYMSKVRNDHTKQRYTSKLYEYHKKTRAKILSEQMSGSGNPIYGRKHSEETRKKISNARRGVNTNTPELIERKRQKWLNDNPNDDPISKQKAIDKNSKTYDITYPDGTTVRIKNLSKFCGEYGLNQGNFVTYGHTKGFLCKKVV